MNRRYVVICVLYFIALVLNSVFIPYGEGENYAKYWPLRWTFCGILVIATAVSYSFATRDPRLSLSTQSILLAVGMIVYPILALPLTRTFSGGQDGWAIGSGIFNIALFLPLALASIVSIILNARQARRSVHGGLTSRSS